MERAYLPVFPAERLPATTSSPSIEKE